MKARMAFAIIVLSLGLFIGGCGDAKNATPVGASPTQHDNETGKVSKAEREVAFAKLSVEDRSLAETQGYCAVTSEPLGSMGPPIKLTFTDQTVFVCCKGCEKKAKSNPDKTLAKVRELKTKVQAERAM